MHSSHYFFFLFFIFPFAAPDSIEQSASSIYDVLKLHGLPTGLLPKGVNNFSYDNSGKFEVHLDQACNAHFEDDLHYDTNVTGILHYGQIEALSGISAKDLFLWLPVIEIRVDIPSSGVIYFNVSVVSKQFSLSTFETPRDCLAVHDGRKRIDEDNVVRTAAL